MNHSTLHNCYGALCKYIRSYVKHETHSEIIVNLKTVENLYKPHMQFCKKGCSSWTNNDTPFGQNKTRILCSKHHDLRHMLPGLIPPWNWMYGSGRARSRSATCVLAVSTQQTIVSEACTLQTDARITEEWHYWRQIPAFNLEPILLLFIPLYMNLE